MYLPRGYHTSSDNIVCKLLKSLYGLKQSPRKWNERLCGDLFEFGFVQSINDYLVFVRNIGDFVVWLLVYVDDIVLIGNNMSGINKVKDFLKSKCLIKDLGKLKFFLGIEVIKYDDALCLTQRKYCLELLHSLACLVVSLSKLL